MYDGVTRVEVRVSWVWESEVDGFLEFYVLGKTQERGPIDVRLVSGSG